MRRPNMHLQIEVGISLFLFYFTRGEFYELGFYFADYTVYCPYGGRK